MLLNVAFFSLPTLSALGTGVFDKAVEWKGMSFMGCSEPFALAFFKSFLYGLPSVSGISRL